MNLSSTAFAMAALSAAGLLTDRATSQRSIVDEAIFSPYGPSCGATLDGSDTVGRGHNLSFTMDTQLANMPAALVFGLSKAAIPLPGGNCQLLVNNLVALSGMTDGNGQEIWNIPAPPSIEGTAFVQSLALDVVGSQLHASNGLQVDFPGTSPTPDPTTQASYPCYYIRNYTWDYGGDGVPAVTGQIRFPSATCNSADGPPAGRPIVVFMHGNGMDHQDHDYLMAYLARNGYVTCSIANGGFLSGTNEGRARQAISYLNSMFRYWGFADRLSGDVVFMGHSRGGEAAVTAARLLKQNPSWAYTTYDVKSVVSIAPTDGGGTIADPKEYLNGTDTESFLGIYGSRDPDVRGLRLEDPLNGPEETVFAIYDRAGTENSVEGLVLQQALLKKSLVYVHGATHLGFTDGCNIASGGTIGCDTHEDLAKGYILAFLRWNVEGNANYRPYFAGQSVPAKIRVTDTEVFTQLSDHGRRVIDNFEQGGLANSTIQGDVSSGAGIAVIAEGEAWQLDPSAPHDTRVARIKWSNSNYSWVRWSIPDRNIANVGNARDVSNYEYLSLRVAQDYNDAWNTQGEDQDFYIRLRSANGYSTRIRASEFGRIAYPDQFITYPYPYPQGDYTKSAMNTIKVPLSAFGNFDPNVATWIYLEFTVPGHRSGSVFVDSIEFTH